MDNQAKLAAALDAGPSKTTQLQEFYSRFQGDRWVVNPPCEAELRSVTNWVIDRVFTDYAHATDTPTTELELTSRTSNFLRNASIATIVELLGAFPEITKYRNCGCGTWGELLLSVAGYFGMIPGLPARALPMPVHPQAVEHLCETRRRGIRERLAKLCGLVGTPPADASAFDKWSATALIAAQQNLDQCMIDLRCLDGLRKKA